jgi:GNAT superfamily N-acetyltransferase
VLEFRDVPMDEEPAWSLSRAMVDEMSRLYDDKQIDGEDMPKATPRELGPPGGAFLVGFDGDHAVCCGGIKDLGDGACELKRMYVVPEARGAGTGRSLLTALEDRARSMGYAIARLDTGPRQPEAEAWYRRAGYAPIDNFNANPVASFFGEKAL